MADKFKGESRDARLSNKNVMRKTNEEVLRKTYENEAYAKCKPEFSAFGDCAKESGLLVVLSCRKQSQAMNACMDLHFSDEGFKKYAEERGFELQPPHNLTDRLTGTGVHKP